MKTQLFQSDSTNRHFLSNPSWRLVLFFLLLWSGFSTIAFGQTKLWDKTIGSSGDDALSAIVATADGGYLLGGISSSGKSGDKTEDSKGGDDYWIVKLNADGSKAWDKTMGGDSDDILASLQQTSDGGYILGGWSISPRSGDKTEDSKGIYDFWVVKVDADGSKVWDKTIGGNGNDNLASLQQTSDGGYILGGSSESDTGGDKTEESKGGADYWIIKLNADGSKAWDKTIGGNSSDFFASLQQTSDGGYILGGSSESDIGGDKTGGNKGPFGTDYWIVKLNADGSKVWDKTIGGNKGEELASLLQTNDGGYILGGSSNSNISGDKTELNHGCNEEGCQPDYWVVKLNADGSIAWDNTIGGNSDDLFASLQQTPDGGYILGGWSISPRSGDKTEDIIGLENYNDYWVVKLNADGSKAWDKTIGGNNDDQLTSLQQTSAGGYILGGFSSSDKSGDKTEDNKGRDNFSNDYWVVKLNNDDNPCNQAVSSFTLLNADTDEELMALQQGDTVDLTTLSIQNLSIRANTVPATVGRVLFTLDSTTEVIDNIAPYTSKTKFANGPHTLTAIPYCEAENGGGKGAALTINFQVKSSERIVTITADKDNTINATSPDSNVGASGVFRTGRTGSDGRFRLQRALLHFDLSSIPPGSRIDSAILTLYVLRTGSTATGVALHKVTTDWSELASTWSNAVSPNIPWTTPGGDFAPIATASTDTVSSGSGILVVPQLTADVQAWVNGSSSNFGWILKVPDEDTTSSAGGAKLISSREHPAERNRPTLRIVYTVKDENPDQPAIQSFTLVNAKNELDLMPLANGDTLNLATLPTHSLNIRANTSQQNGINVKFALSGQQSRSWKELGYPYALFGDEGGNYHSWAPAPGNYTLTATPYTDAGGVKGTPLTISFTVVNKVAVQSFTLVNAKNEQDLMPLSDGDTIDLAELPTRFLNIRANTSQSNGINVTFDLSGRQSRTWTERGYPYALYGDEGGNYHSWAPARGNYTLTANPSLNNGAPGQALTITFTVVGQRPATASSSSSIAGELQTAETVYPNPTRAGKIKVVLPQQVQGEITYTLVSLLGAKLAGGELNLSSPTTEVAFDFSAQMKATGVYFLHLKGQHLQTVLRVVRQ